MLQNTKGKFQIKTHLNKDCKIWKGVEGQDEHLKSKKYVGKVSVKIAPVLLNYSHSTQLLIIMAYLDSLAINPIH